jgi:hypothetical protein
MRMQPKLAGLPIRRFVSRGCKCNDRAFLVLLSIPRSQITRETTGATRRVDGNDFTGRNAILDVCARRQSVADFC